MRALCKNRCYSFLVHRDNFTGDQWSETVVINNAVGLLFTPAPIETKATSVALMELVGHERNSWPIFLMCWTSQTLCLLLEVAFILRKIQNTIALACVCIASLGPGIYLPAKVWSVRVGVGSGIAHHAWWLRNHHVIARRRESDGIVIQSSISERASDESSEKFTFKHKHD